MTKRDKTVANCR